jgi:hypothetical protein
MVLTHVIISEYIFFLAWHTHQISMFDIAKLIPMGRFFNTIVDVVETWV